MKKVLPALLSFLVSALIFGLVVLIHYYKDPGERLAGSLERLLAILGLALGGLGFALLTEYFGRKRRHGIRRVFPVVVAGILFSTSCAHATVERRSSGIGVAIIVALLAIGFAVAALLSVRRKKMYSDEEKKGLIGPSNMFLFFVAMALASPAYATAETSRSDNSGVILVSVLAFFFLVWSVVWLIAAIVDGRAKGKISRPPPS